MEAKRDPVGYRYDLLNWHFLGMMARIAHYATFKYDDTPHQSWHTLNYQAGELKGDKSPINHAIAHIKQYIVDEPYDKWDQQRCWHLAAAAYNLMMEAYYEMGSDSDAP